MKNQEQKSSKKLVLLLGATGRSGFFIAQRLLESEQYPVRVIVRSRAKLLQYFKQKQISFQQIIQGDINDLQTLEKAFKQSDRFGKVKLVVNAIGATDKISDQDVQKIQLTSIKNIIDLSVQHQIQKFIHLSAALMTRPWHPVTAFLNTIVPNVYYYKSQAENYLRNSKLNYSIIRPPRLIGQIGSKKDQNPTGYDIEQGDKVQGFITRRTLSQVIIHTIKAKEIPAKTTFQCKANLQKRQCNPENFSLLKHDKEQSIVNASHRLAKYTYWALCPPYLIGATVLFFMRLVKK